VAKYTANAFFKFSFGGACPVEVLALFGANNNNNDDDDHIHRTYFLADIPRGSADSLQANAGKVPCVRSRPLPPQLIVH
jgi:hypothetical protein